MPKIVAKATTKSISQEVSAPIVTEITPKKKYNRKKPVVDDVKDEIKDEVRFIAQDWNYAIEQLTLKTELLSEKELAYAHRIVNNREKTSYKKLILFLESK